MKYKFIKYLFWLLVFMPTMTAIGQNKYFSREGKILFDSKTVMEDISAINKKAASVLDIETGQIEFSVLMRAFEFKKALMMEHFNENYVESSKYPKAIFKGTILNPEKVSWNKDGAYPIQISGTMNFHGVEKVIEIEAKIFVKDSKISGQSDFEIVLKDYEIDVPNLVKDNIASTIKVQVNISYEPLKLKSK